MRVEEKKKPFITVVYCPTCSAGVVIGSDDEVCRLCATALNKKTKGDENVSRR